MFPSVTGDALPDGLPMQGRDHAMQVTGCTLKTAPTLPGGMHSKTPADEPRSSSTMNMLASFDIIGVITNRLGFDLSISLTESSLGTSERSSLAYPRG